MKKPTSALLLIILACSTTANIFAQASRFTPQTPNTTSIPEVAGDFAQFDRVDAITDGNGVLIRWQMGRESYNVGFHVYRIESSGAQILNHSFIPGSAATSRTSVAEGETYEYFDSKAGIGATYFIKSTALDGRESSTKPFAARFVRDLELETGRSSAERQLAEAGKAENSNVRGQELDVPQEIRSTVNAGLAQVDLPTHQWVVAQPGGVKIGVKNDGMYRVTRAQLNSAGFDGNSDSTNWRLFLDGVEQAVIIGPGGDYIEFYGRGIDIVETNTRIYYLIGGTVPGKRITSKVLRPIGSNIVSPNFRVTTVKKERIAYKSVNNGPEENFFGRIITSTTPTPANEIPFTVNGFDPNVPRYTVTIRLLSIQGASHRISVLINGHFAGFVTGTQNSSYAQELLVPSSFFVEGENKLSMTDSLSGRVSYFDRISVKYSRKYKAEGDKLSYATPGYRKVDVAGFSTPNVRIFDLTLASDPVEVTNLSIVDNGGSHTVRIPSTRPMVMHAFTDATISAVSSVVPNIPSTLNNPDNGAQLIIISDPDPAMIAASETWADYRRSGAGGSITVKVVSVTDVFDEFDYGLPTSTAIREFLHHARDNWSESPSYVLLMGDASYDPRNYEGTGVADSVPTKFVNLIYEESGSDEALADFSVPPDGLADLAIGRIPARTPGVVTTVLNKTMGFEGRSGQSLDRGALFVYDTPFGNDFEAMSRALAVTLPESMPKMFVGRGMPFPNGNTIDPNGPANVLNGINSGKYVVNYAGHGSAGLWASSDFFGNSTVPSLTNADNLSLFVMLTCFNGQFFRTQSDSLAEVLLKAPNGGAVASWASTTETVATYQQLMGDRFFEKIGEGQILRLGDLIIEAKSGIAGSDVGYSWALIGDPMLQVRAIQ